MTTWPFVFNNFISVKLLVASVTTFNKSFAGFGNTFTFSSTTSSTEVALTQPNVMDQESNDPMTCVAGTNTFIVHNPSAGNGRNESKPISDANVPVNGASAVAMCGISGVSLEIKVVLV